MSNLPGRFERFTVETFDDGWGSADEPLPRRQTEVTDARARTILAKNDSPDIPFSSSINPYRGCEHGCIYCFARPSHAFLDLSPGLDFETRILAKPNAAELLRRTFSRTGYVCTEAIALGANTDPYQPAERTWKVTRSILEVMSEYRHPFSIVTKSNLVLRDLDLLHPMAREGLAHVYVSVTTLDRKLARAMEPRAVTPVRRLSVVRQLNASGVPASVLVSPVIPGLNDAELESIMDAASDAGARTIGYLVVRLPNEVKVLFEEWIRARYPDRADKVLNRIRELRGGRLNDPRFGTRHTGEGEWARLLKQRFEVARRRLGFPSAKLRLDTTRFRVPSGPGTQQTLFG